MQILVVDDQMENRYMLESLLKGNGHQVLTAENGSEALDIIKAGRIDMIISDILMPVMDGFELCRQVKNQEEFRLIPFIIYSATYTSLQDREFALKLGADKFIEKPCEPDVFMNTINKLLTTPHSVKTQLKAAPLEEKEALKLYSQRLVNKIEQKMQQAEQENRKRIKVEKELRKNRERLIDAQRVAKMGDFTWDMETNEITWSEALFELLGYDKSAPLDLERVYNDIHHPEDHPAVLQWLQEAAASGQEKLHPMEYRIFRKDGTMLFVRTMGKIRQRADKKPEIFATIQDISERKKSEKALKEAYDIITRSSSVAFTWQNKEGWPVDFVSENVEKLFGYTSEAFINGEVAYPDCIHPHDLDRVTEEVAENSSIPDKKEFRHTPYRVITKTGEVKTVRDWTFIKRNRKGDVTHYKGIIEDITLQKKNEKEKEKLQRQLAQAQKLESIGRLAGGVAHDYNNMLSVIMGFAGLAMDSTPRDNPVYNDLEEIMGAAKRSAEITRQLLAFARKETVEPRVFDFNDTIEKMLKMLGRLIGEEIQLSWQPGRQVGSVMMDPSQMDQILANLSVNARDAINGVGKITIETSAVRFTEEDCNAQPDVLPGDFAVLAFSDNGSGMNQHTLDNLFEPFFTTKPVHKGTGLGLATVYGIVKQNTGFINVYSEPDKGTTFRVYLPVYKGDETINVPDDNDILEKALLSRGETILVVEDQPAILKFTKKILEKFGYRVLEAATPEKGINTAKAHQSDIHLLITDVILPGMNGLEFSEQIKIIYPDVKILFMSGYAAEIITGRCQSSDEFNFIQKPFSLRDLAVKIRRILDGPA
ncbi:MAG: response regulator [Desulfobacteraceae bacterium]